VHTPSVGGSLVSASSLTHSHSHQGFYHADPHPGNLLRMRDGRLCYLDFGMVRQWVSGSVRERGGHLHPRDMIDVGLVGSKG
jgi:serine/threonine protein kinase